MDDVIVLAETKISIHALREEGDQLMELGLFAGEKFLSTPSVRRATLTPGRASTSEYISIHALREEGDAPRRDSGSSFS